MEERRNEILKELDRKGRVKVTDLSKEFGCSEVTIRNDIKAMDIEGLLKRTHGGAVKVETETERKYSAETIYRNVTQKKQIAVVTNSLIAGNELAGVGHVELSIATPQMEVKKAIMKAAEKVYVLADSSKFGGGYLSVICPTNEVDKIITDDGVSKEDIQKAKELIYRWLSRNGEVRMERQQKAYKGVIDYFKRRSWTENCVREKNCRRRETLQND